MDKKFLRALKTQNRRNSIIRLVTDDGDKIGETYLEESGNGDLANTATANSIFEAVDFVLMERLDK